MVGKTSAIKSLSRVIGADEEMRTLSPNHRNKPVIG